MPYLTVTHQARPSETHEIIKAKKLTVSNFVLLLLCYSVLFCALLQIKDSIVQQISNVKVNNLYTLTQVTSVIARVTLEPNEVTAETQVICVARVQTMLGT